MKNPDSREYIEVKEKELNSFLNNKKLVFRIECEKKS
jgi:hypothetical protein